MNEFQERVGVGEPCYAFTTAKGRAPRRRTVIREEGTDRGEPAGYEMDHPDGRQDATVFAPTVTLQGENPT